MSHKGLKEKEKLFCQFYHLTRNPKEAALRAGYYLRAEQTACRLLQRQDVIEELGRLQSRQEDVSKEVETGYRRIAFGSVSDAVELLCMGDEPDLEAIRRMDLFNISEIKYQKGKGMEIRFFDRIRALEKLEEFHQAQDETGAAAFYRALEEGARRISACSEGGAD